MINILILSCFLIPPTYSSLQEQLKKAIPSAYFDALSYSSWDWKVNMKNNGLLLHLVQTSFRTILNKPEPATYTQWTQFKKTSSIPATKHIIYILCESCWYNKHLFSELFQPLLDEGFISLRGISPVYGGGTPNAEFEMLTTLPALGVLNGVIYQEYGELLSETTNTLVTLLRNRGYQTLAFHNSTKEFWRRMEVLPKLGFNQFYSINLCMKIF